MLGVHACEYLPEHQEKRKKKKPSIFFLFLDWVPCFRSNYKWDSRLIFQLRPDLTQLIGYLQALNPALVREAWAWTHVVQAQAGLGQLTAGAIDEKLTAYS